MAEIWSEIEASAVRDWVSIASRAWREIKSARSGATRKCGSASWRIFQRWYADASELLAGACRFRFHSHIIFYTEQSDGVLVRALSHVVQNIRRELFERPGYTDQFMKADRPGRWPRSL